MATFSVYLPPEDRIGDPIDHFVLVRDGKSPLALVFPPFWLAWHGLWLELLAYIVAALAILLLMIWQPGAPAGYLSALPGLYLLLEGTELVRGKYERQGWHYDGIIEGENRDEAEIRYVANRAAKPNPVQTTPAPVQKPMALKPIVNTGLFPE
ncbi:MAG: DUF2628 domain-containing protein [Pseudomonadota bacterium]